MKTGTGLIDRLACNIELPPLSAEGQELQKRFADRAWRRWFYPKRWRRYCAIRAERIGAFFVHMTDCLTAEIGRAIDDSDDVNGEAGEA